MSRKRVKQYLMLLVAIGVISVAMTGNGTFATFDAQVSNPGNTFTTGTLFLHDTSGGTTCTSESAQSATFNYNPGDGTNGNQCAVLFNGASLTGGAVTAHLALSNAGTVDASDLKFSVDSCTVGDNFANTTSHVTFGTAPTCGQLYLTIQETQSDYSTPVFCAYGPGTPGVSCNSPGSSATLATAAGPSLTTMQMDNGSHVATPATLAHGATRYYLITINPGGVPSGNQLQNRSVSFGMTWHIDQ